jgi:uncharacterized protein (TIGR02231 family)
MTMRSRILISLSSLIALSPALAAAQAPAAPITAVVVYSDRAQVTRTQTVECASNEARFPGLPSTIDPKSIWATLSNDGAGSVQGVTVKEEATGPRPRAEALQLQIRKIDEENLAKQGELAAASAAESKLASFRSHLSTVWGRQATGAKPPVGSWDAALDLLRKETLAAAARRRKAEDRQRELARERAKLVSDLQMIERDRRRTTFTATAFIRCKGRQPVQLSYVVPGATWRISYQVRAEPGQGTAAIRVLAVVEQGTGEDWTSTSLAVSTANLQRQNIPPDLGTMRVGTHKPYDTRKVLTRRFEQRTHLSAGDVDGKAIDKSKQEAKKDTGGAAAGEAEAEPGLAMQLTAAGKVTIPADGRSVVVTLSEKSSRALYGLETVPKLYPFVYNRVALKNPFSFPLLPGPVELFRGRSFLGNAQLKLRSPGEPFTLSLGVNDQVQVSRFLKREQLEGAGALGSKKKLHHHYTIQVGNWTQQPQTVHVLENIPVSQVHDIVVSLGDSATTPTKWNKVDGIMSWDLKLPARSKKVITVAYTITLPDSYVVTGY